MKLSEIAEKYGWKEGDLEGFLYWKTDIKMKGMMSKSIADEDVPRAIKLFMENAPEAKEATTKAARELKEEAERIAKQKAERQKALPSMLISSGFSFEGYRIIKYAGYISGDDAIQINRDELFAGQGQKLTDALVQIRIQALKEVKEAAYDLGCNAVIGVDFDYMTFEPESIKQDYSGTTHYYQPYVVCVTANGNAVVIEKE